MKTFAAWPPAQAIAFALAVGTVARCHRKPSVLRRVDAALCLLATAMALGELASLLVPDRYTLGILVGFAEWWFEAGDLAVLPGASDRERADARAMSVRRRL